MKALLVEDNIINQKILLLNLNKIGYEVDVASNGLEAIEYYKNNTYSFILMDIMMPEMDGLEATREIRKLEENTNEHIPIIALTANTFNSDRITCLEVGMDEYMTKPFDIAVLKNYLSRFDIGV